MKKAVRFEWKTAFDLEGNAQETMSGGSVVWRVVEDAMICAVAARREPDEFLDTAVTVRRAILIGKGDREPGGVV